MSAIPPEEPKVSENVQIQPAMHVAPGPVTMNVTTQSLPTGEKIIILHIEDSTGSHFSFLNPEFAKAMGDKLIEQATGITIAPANSRIIHG